MACGACGKARRGTNQVKQARMQRQMDNARSNGTSAPANSVGRAIIQGMQKKSDNDSMSKARKFYGRIF